MKESEALIRKGLKQLAERRRREAEKGRLPAEVAEPFAQRPLPDIVVDDADPL